MTKLHYLLLPLVVVTFLCFWLEVGGQAANLSLFLVSVAAFLLYPSEPLEVKDVTASIVGRVLAEHEKILTSLVNQIQAEKPAPKKPVAKKKKSR